MFRNLLTRDRGRWAALAAAVTAALGLALGLTATASATGHTTRAADGGVKPTIVLVHGGWDNSSGWNAVVTQLQDRGFPVIAPANPLRDLASDSAYVSSVLDTITGPVVLVGHSYGGAVITNAAVGHTNVKALVFIAGWALDQGDSIASLITKFPGSLIGPSTTIGRPYPLPDGSQGTDLYLTRQGVATAFAADASPKVQNQIFAEQRPFSVDAFNSQSGPPAWKTTPSWYLVTTEDKAIPPATQMFMAQRAGSQIREVRSSHVAMYTHPQNVVDIILEAATSVS
jgi:pimeloyl-ACP methyl ester carboxylesterase